MGGTAFSYQAPLCGTSCQFGFRKQTRSLPLRLDSKLSFLTQLIVRDGSGDSHTWFSYNATSLDCWGTSHDALLLPLLSLLSMYMWHYCCHQLVFLFLSRYPWPGVVVLFVPSFLSSQPKTGQDGRPSWFWWRFLPLHCHLMHAPDGGLNRREHSMKSVGFKSALSELDYFGFNCISFNWILIGLQWIGLWTVFPKCLEMTVVVIWFDINKTETKILLNFLKTKVLKNF